MKTAKQIIVFISGGITISALFAVAANHYSRIREQQRSSKIEKSEAEAMKKVCSLALNHFKQSEKIPTALKAEMSLNEISKYVLN